MADIVNLSDFKRLQAAKAFSAKYPWHEVYTIDDAHSALQIYVNEQSGDVEIVQADDDGKIVRTTLFAKEVPGLVQALNGGRQ